MTMDLGHVATDTESLWRGTQDEPAVRSRTVAGRPALALGALLTAVKVALAALAILVVLPAAMAAQVAIAR